MFETTDHTPPTSHTNTALVRFIDEAMTEHDASAVEVEGESIPFGWRLLKRSRLHYFTGEVSMTWRSDDPTSFGIILDPSPRPIRTAPSSEIAQPRKLQLCHRCVDFNFEAVDEDSWNWFSSAEKLGVYSEITLADDCPMCELFRCLTSKYMKSAKVAESTFFLAAFPTSALYADDWFLSKAPAGIQETFSYSIVDEATLLDETGVRHPEFIRAVGCISPVSTDEDSSSFGARILNPRMNLDVVRSWLNYCCYCHAGTCSPSTPLLQCPISVIDCQSRQIVDLNDEHGYLAFSYVWGPPTDKEPTEALYLRGPKLAPQLPATIEDAILLTQKLGFKYLWVDRYCIPQDDERKRSVQIAHMDQIYAGADVTIIAAAGDGPYHGLPGLSQRLRQQGKQVSLGRTTYTFVPPDPAHEIQSSTWNTRGWTYQEALLSRRRLIICEEQVYFECSAMHCYEAMHAPLHLLHMPSLERFSPWNEPGLFPILEQRYLLDQITRYLAQYTKRTLSQPTDMLNGMLGVFAAFGQKPVGGIASQHGRKIMQIAGIPIVPDATLQSFSNTNPQMCSTSRAEQFVTGLAWRSSKPSARRLEFPSWTWAGWSGHVEPRNEYEGYIHNHSDVNFGFSFSPLGVDSDEPLEGIENVIERYRRDPAMANKIPYLVACGTTLEVRLETPPEVWFCESDGTTHHARADTNMEVRAQIKINGEFAYCDRFSLNSQECVADDMLAFRGLILGVAHGTYYAGEEQLRTITGNQLKLIILVLWKRNGLWERAGLIEQNLYLNTVDGVRKYLDIARLSTARESLRLK